jgi:hypothetical protein
MADRSWFFASQGQQQGPYPETKLREFIANGTVTAETLVWTEGMAGWLRAADVPGLMAAASGPPAIPQPGGWPASAGPAGGAVSVDLGIWGLLGWALLLLFGFLLVIPAPWVATGFCKWFVERLRVPQRPNLSFTGQPGDIWYVFMIEGLCTYAGFSGAWYPPLIVVPLQAWLSWMAIRWVAANISSNGQPLRLGFAGSALGYIGWDLLLYVSAITIIGWAWVITAWMRWNCRHIAGTRREVVFTATGWQMLWRTLVYAFGLALIIPIPWAIGWYTRWYVSQFALVESPAHANA